MKTTGLLLLAVAGLSSQAAVVRWDADATTAGAQDGAGTWDAVNTNWWDGVANTNWSDATPDTAVIGAASGTAGPIAVSGTRTASGLLFTPPGGGFYSLSGGALTLGADGLVITPSVVTGLPLDSVSVPAAGAWSLRRLRTAYTGPAVNVRRPSDNVTQDIGFDAAGALDVAALLAFVGSETGAVTRWYDQSGNGRDGVQATAANQPLLLNPNGKWAVLGRGGQYLTATNATVGMMTDGGSNGTAVIVCRAQNVQQNSFGWYGSERWAGHLNWDNGNLYFDAGNAAGARINVGNGSAYAWQQYSLVRSNQLALIRWGGLQRAANTGASGSASVAGGGWGVLGGANLTPYPTVDLAEYIQFAAGLGPADLQVVESSEGYFYGLQIDSPSAAQPVALATPVTLASAQTWTVYSNGTLTAAGDVANAGNLLTVNNWGPVALNGVLSGTGGLAKVGEGTVTLGGAAVNTYGGSTVLAQGRIELAKTGGAAAVPADFIGDNQASPDVYTLANNQFAPGSVMRFVGNAGDHVRFELLGTTQTLAGIDNTASPGRGVIQQREQVAPGSVGTVSCLVLDGSGQYSFDAYLRDNGGQMALVKAGSGTQTLANTLIDHTGITTISGGVLRVLNLDDYWTTQVTVNAGATLVNENTSRAFYGRANTAYRGGGTWRKTGSQTMSFSWDRGCTVAFEPGALMDIQQGVVQLDYGARADFSSNRASLHVAAGAIFDVWDNELSYGGVFVDALTGSGSVRKTQGSVGRLTAGVSGGSSTYYGMLTNQPARPLQLVKVGAGTLTLAGTNWHSGATTVAGGTLALAASGSVSNSQTISVSPGALLDLTAVPDYAIAAGQMLAGGGLVTGSLLLADGAILAPGGLGSAGALTFGNDLTLSAGSTSVVELVNPAVTGGVNDLAIVGGALAPNGARILLGAGLSNGTYTIMKYGSKAGSFNPAVLSAARGSATVDETVPGEIRLTVLAGGASLVWNSTSGTNWDTGVSLNWLNGTTNDVFLSGDAVLFNDLSGVVQGIGIPAVVLPSSVTVDTSANAFTFVGTGGIGGVGALTKTGSSLLTLATENSYAGGTVVSGGSLKIRHSSALGGGAVSVAAGASLQLGPSGLVITNALTLNGVTAGGALIGGLDSGNVFNRWLGPVTLAGGTNNITTWWNDKTFELAGLVTGPGALLVERVSTGNNASVVMLSGAANDYAGGTLVSNATLILNNAGGNPIGTGGLLIYPNGTLQIGNNTPGGSLPVATITNNGTLNLYRSDACLFSNNVTGSGTLNLYQPGGNTLTLGGGSTITQGTLNVFAGTFSNTTARFGTSWHRQGYAGLVIAPGANVTVDGTMYLTPPDGNTMGYTYIVGGSLTATRAQDARDSLYTVIQTGGEVTFGQLLANQAYPGAGNQGGTDYTQKYILTGGRLTVGQIWGSYGGSWERAIDLYMGGGTLRASANQSLDARTIYLTGTNGNATIDTAGFTVSHSYNQPMQGTGGLVKAGSGVLVYHHAEAYTGPTTISNGLLLVQRSLSTGGVHVAAGGTLGGTGAVLGAVSNAGTVAPGTAGTAGLLTVGAYQPAGGGVLSIEVGGTTQGSQYDCLVASNGATLGGSLNFSMIGAFVPTHGDSFTILQGGPVSGTFAATNLVLPLGFGGAVQYTPTSVVVGVTGSLFVLSWRPTEQASWDLARTNWVDNNTNAIVFSQAASVRFDDLGAYSNVVTLTTNLQPSRVVVDATSNYWFQGAGYLSGGMELVKTGAATLVVATTNSFSGGTTIHEGVLQLGDGGVSAVLGSGFISNNASLVFNHGDTNSPSTVIAGTGSVTKAGSGQLTLQANNTYAGATIVSGGTLVLNTPNFYTYLNGNIFINGTSTLMVTQTGGAFRYDLTGRVITFDATGGGTLTSGAGLNWTWGGNTFVTSGGARDNITGLSGFNWGIGGGCTFNVVRGTDPAADLVMSVSAGNTAAGLTKNGNGILLLTTNNAFTGGAALNAGVLAVGHDVALGPGTLTMAGGTLMAAGGARALSNLVTVSAASFVDTSGGDLTLNGAVSGSAALIKQGTGTLTLVSINAYSGNTMVSNGTLLVNGSIGAGVVTIDAGATLGGTGVVQGVVSQNGILSPGVGIGLLTISNQVSCGGASVTRFELGGTNSYDQLVVSDLHILNGTLEVVTTNGYVPASGDRFNLITNTALGGLLFGPFPSTSLPALPSGMGWEVQYSASDAVNLVVTGSVVSLTAYEQWAAQIPNPADRGDQNDADNDGYANLLEYSQGSDPTNNANNAKLNLVRTNGMEVIVFNRVNTATDIVYEVQGSYAPTNNAEWQGLATNSVGSWGGSTNVNDDNTATIHRVWVSDLILGTNRSLRLKVTRP